MFTTFWPLEMGTLHGRNISLKNQNARSFFLSHTCKLNQQTHWGVVSKKVQQIYNKYDFFSENILLTNHETLYYLDIVLSFYRPFEPSTALFTITGLWPKKQTPF